ncbi:MAG: hypothetical protein AAGJ85_05985, partial [Pseudomonadota bacterium]
IHLPSGASHEVMHRADRLYDLVFELDWNMWPRSRHRGSAIFFHLAHEDYRPTEGCIAIAQPDMLTALSLSGPGAAIEVSF